MIRIVVAYNSLAAWRWISDLIGSQVDMEVVGDALNGREIVAMVTRLRPNVIIMDMSTPLTSGIQATQQIMARFPTPIVVLSSAGPENSPADLEVGKALRAGAFRAIEKPDRDTDRRQWARRFLDAIRTSAHARTARHIGVSGAARPLLPGGAEQVKLVAIGASAGGPATLASILAALGLLPIPVLVVNHFPQAMFPCFIDWLNATSIMPVAPARAGTPLRSLAGTVSVAVPGTHLVVAAGHLATMDGPPVNHCKPAVDIFFRSVAKTVGDRAVAVLLTGMGRDGAEGMLRIREAGGRTIAQDEATSLIFGMPKAAIELGAAGQILPDREIPDAIVRLCGQASNAYG